MRCQDRVHDLGLGDVVGAGLTGDLPVHQRGAHIAGVDAVGGDAVGAAFQGDDLGQALQSMFDRHTARVARSSGPGVRSHSGQRDAGVVAVSFWASDSAASTAASA